MGTFNSKWMLAIIIIIVILVILYAIGRKSVHVEITIQASPEEVWSVLTNTKHISAWNTVLIPIEGELKEGNTIKYEFHQDAKTSSTMSAKVKERIDYKLLNQQGGMMGVLTFDHKYILSPVGNSTLVTIHEEYRGIAVSFWNPKPVEQAYHQLLKELNDRVTELRISK